MNFNYFTVCVVIPICFQILILTFYKLLSFNIECDKELLIIKEKNMTRTLDDNR